MAQKPETKFRQNTVRPFLLRLKNTFFEPIQQKAIHGSPDFVLCVHGRFVSLELKDVKGSVSKLQEYKLERVRETGGVRIVASKLNWQEVKKQLSEMDSSKEKAWKVNTSN